MDELGELQQLLQIVKMQEEMTLLMEEQEQLFANQEREIVGLSEQLDESLQLNEALLKQNKTLQQQLNELKKLNN